MTATKAKNEAKTHADDPLLTMSEVARQLGKSPSTIGRWVQDGLLKAVRLPGGIPHVRRSEVNAFLGSSALDKQVK